jgi:hypothetical protein
MKRKLVGVLVVGTLVASVASACSSKGRDYGVANGAGGEGTAGKSGSGPDERGGNQAKGGNETSGGTGGEVLVVGGSASAEGGAADADGGACSESTQNVCGGCTKITGTLGDSCGACSVTACAADKNSLHCNTQCTGAEVCVSGVNQCKTPDCSAADSCGKPDMAGGSCTNAKGNCPAKPNSTGSCAGSDCAYVCKGISAFAETLSCSTSKEPACGSWNFESNGADPFEGWSLQASAVSAATGGLYLATPPGGEAAYGKHSLALKVDGITNAKYSVTISRDFCPTGAPATGIQGAFHAMVRFQPDNNTPSGGLGGPADVELSGVGTAEIDTNCPAGVWFDVASASLLGNSVSHVNVYVGGIDGHKGTLYFDNLHFD